LDLTVREYELLVRLASAGGNPVSRAALLRDVWRMSFDPGSGVLDVQVSRLRDKLGKSASRLETIRGVGYRLRREP
jgi:DNA-binding response OmpR family regulator